MIYTIRFKAVYKNAAHETYQTVTVNNLMNIDEIYPRLKQEGYRDIQELKIITYSVNGITHVPYDDQLQSQSK